MTQEYIFKKGIRGAQVVTGPQIYSQSRSILKGETANKAEGSRTGISDTL